MPSAAPLLLARENLAFGRPSWSVSGVQICDKCGDSSAECLIALILLQIGMEKQKSNLFYY